MIGTQAMQQPRTSILDNHTKIFILLAKRTVIAGRTLAVLASDIKLPFPKKDIQKEDKVAGIQFHLSDELYRSLSLSLSLSLSHSLLDPSTLITIGQLLIS